MTTKKERRDREGLERREVHSFLKSKVSPIKLEKIVDNLQDKLYEKWMKKNRKEELLK